MRIVIAGANGLIGKALVRHLVDQNYKVVALLRKPQDLGCRHALWDGQSLGPWASELEGADAIVNMAGLPISVPWTPENKRKIVSSRVDSTALIARSIEKCSNPPRQWLNASAIGFYGDTGDRETDESSPAGTGFLADTCIAWEAAAQTDKCTVTLLRTGFVLGKGGALDLLVRLTKGFLGGSVGSGRQYMPWIHIEDHVTMMLWCLQNSVSGPVNLVGPNPATNKAFMAELRRKLGRPWSPPAPAIALHMLSKLGGLPPDLALVSSRVVPTKATKGGFSFRFPNLSDALDDLVQ